VGNSATAVSLPPAGDHPVRDWAAAAVSTPYASANRFAVLGFTTTDDYDGPQRAFVQPRRNSRRRRRSSSELSTHNQPRSTAQQQRRGPLLLGKAKNGSFISAARKQRKKTVLCLDNVNTACSVEQITAFIRSLSFNVLTCFEVKPRRRYHECEHDNKRVRLGNNHDVEQCTRQVYADDGYVRPTLQSTNNQISPVDPTTASFCCMFTITYWR